MSVKSIGTIGKSTVVLEKHWNQKEKHWFYNQKHRNQRKRQKPNTGFTMKSIGTNEKALAFQSKTYEPTKKLWFYYEKHRNQRESIGVIVKSIGTSEKKHWFYIGVCIQPIGIK